MDRSQSGWTDTYATDQGSYGYDAAGNLASDSHKGLLFSYNLANLPSKVEGVGYNAGLTYSYGYLSDGTEANQKVLSFIIWSKIVKADILCFYMFHQIKAEISLDYLATHISFISLFAISNMFFFNILRILAKLFVSIILLLILLSHIGNAVTNQHIGITGFYFTQNDVTFISEIYGNSGDEHFSRPRIIIEKAGEVLYNHQYICTCGHCLGVSNASVYHIIKLNRPGHYQTIYSYESIEEYKAGLDSLAIDLSSLKYLKYKKFNNSVHLELSPLIN